MTSGVRRVVREPHGKMTSIDVEVKDELGRTLRGHGEPLSSMVLGHSTSVCVCTALAWTIDGETIFGEDQDVWPNHEWQARNGRWKADLA